MKTIIRYLILSLLSPTLFFSGGSYANKSVDNSILTHVSLSVAYVVNPRFEKMSRQDIEKILKRVSEISQDRFELEIEVSQIDEIDIADFFNPRRSGILGSQLIKTHMLKPDSSSKGQLSKGLFEAFEPMSLDVLKKAVSNQTNGGAVDISQSKKKIIEQIANLHIDRLIEIKSIQVPSDNKGLILDDLYNEFMAWSHIIGETKDYDLIISNQLVASAETYLPTVHSSMRGGITSGFADKGKATHGGSVLVTTYPFVSRDAFFSQARGRDYSKEESIEAIAFMTIHELGHLMKYRRHYYDHPGCVMRPAPGLHYLEWVREIELNGKCNLDHDLYLKPHFNQ